jgi:hypothetical protein
VLSGTVDRGNEFRAVGASLSAAEAAGFDRTGCDGGKTSLSWLYGAFEEGSRSVELQQPYLNRSNIMVLVLKRLEAESLR